MALAAPDLALLRWLARREAGAGASAIGAACALAPGDVRGQLASLESRRLVSSRQDARARPPGRVYFVTHEGRRHAGIVAVGVAAGP